MVVRPQGHACGKRKRLKETSIVSGWSESERAKVGGDIFSCGFLPRRAGQAAIHRFRGERRNMETQVIGVNIGNWLGVRRKQDLFHLLRWRRLPCGSQAEQPSRLGI